LQISELEELRNEAYENVRITKNRVKVFHDKFIIRKTFVPGQKVLLYNSTLHLLPQKLKSRWTGPFVVRTVFSHGAVEIATPKTRMTLRSMGNVLTILGIRVSNKTMMGLFDLMYR